MGFFGTAKSPPTAATCRHDITRILLKVVLHTYKPYKPSKNINIFFLTEIIVKKIVYKKYFSTFTDVS